MTIDAAEVFAKLSTDPVVFRVLTDAIDEHGAMLEVMVKNDPADMKLKADLMTIWGLQACLFGRTTAAKG